MATAETQWKAAKEQARLAKRRRKEVKLIARRARKQARQAKADLAEAEEGSGRSRGKTCQFRRASGGQQAHPGQGQAGCQDRRRGHQKESGASRQEPDAVHPPCLPQPVICEASHTCVRLRRALLQPRPAQARSVIGNRMAARLNQRLTATSLAANLTFNEYNHQTPTRHSIYEQTFKTKRH